MGPRPHSVEWYRRLARSQQGYPSTSQDVEVGAYGGEVFYLDFVKAHMRPDEDVMDVGCGHGEDALRLAQLCRNFLGYDPAPSFIELARENARAAGLENVTFLVHDSSAKANQGRVRIPVGDESLDLIISRRGPVHWIADAKRVVRSGGVLIQLCMSGRLPVPEWNVELPEPFDRENHHLPDMMLDTVKGALADAGIELHSFWTFDVPALLDGPGRLYKALAFGRPPADIPSYSEVEEALKAIFFRHRKHGKLDIRQRRLLWKAVIDK